MAKNVQQQVSPSKTLSKLSDYSLTKNIMTGKRHLRPPPAVSSVPHFSICLTVAGCLLIKHSRRWKRRLLIPHILHRQAVVLHGCYLTKALHSRLPYAKCITRHVCATPTPKCERDTWTTRPCFHTFSTFPGICVHISVCECVWYPPWGQRSCANTDACLHVS